MCYTCYTVQVFNRQRITVRKVLETVASFLEVLYLGKTFVRAWLGDVLPFISGSTVTCILLSLRIAFK